MDDSFFCSRACLGGAGGTVVSLFSVHQLVQKSLMNASTDVVFTVLYMLAVGVGVALWRNSNIGTIWAAILFALQAPVISSPVFSYEWFTGVTLKLIGGNQAYQWHFELGGANNFYWHSDIVESTWGGNLFAISASIFLLITPFVNSSAKLK